MLTTIIIILIKMHTNFELFANSWSLFDIFHGNNDHFIYIDDFTTNNDS